MDIPIHAPVYCADGEAGDTVCVIVHPYHREVTHVVVKEKGLMGEEHLVPVDLIVESKPTQIQLRCTTAELNKMETFIKYHYIPATDDYLSYEAAHHYYHPYLYPDSIAQDAMFTKLEKIPPEELTLHRGASVFATDGRVGQVDELLISPTDHHISHLVLQEGHLWGKKHITIPVSAIKDIEDDAVSLTMNREAIAKLPAVPVRAWSNN